MIDLPPDAPKPEDHPGWDGDEHTIGIWLACAALAIVCWPVFVLAKIRDRFGPQWIQCTECGCDTEGLPCDVCYRG
jgi:hypothetical protein